MTTGSPSKIGVIICSQRKPRAGPQIATFVLQTLQSISLEPSSLTLIDLSEWNLPLFDESTIPSQVTDHSQYDHPHTRAWSVEIQRYDAFIFVTPQYNWGYPASVKNAIDYLYHEWKGKPALIVSYGGHGGGKAAAQLRQVLCGVRMRPTIKMPELMFPGKEFLGKAARGDQLGLTGGDDEIWSAERKIISEAFTELLELLSANVGS